MNRTLRRVLRWKYTITLAVLLTVILVYAVYPYI